MAERVSAGPLGELSPGALKLVVVGGERVLVANVGGELLAFQADCPHRGGPLPEGSWSGTVLTCPWHGYRWDTRAGRNVWPGVPSQRLRCFRVEVVAGEVLVEAP